MANKGKTKTLRHQGQAIPDQRHGRTGTPEFRLWHSILRRCYSPSSTSYPRYGGRGIAVCDRWRTSFNAFVEDMGLRPSTDYTIDRRDSTKGYFCGLSSCGSCGPTNQPPNCRWATRTEQQNNRSNNRWYEYNGEKYTAPMLARLCGKNPRTVAMRLSRGWTIEDALTR